MPVKFEIKAKTGEKDGKAIYSKIGVVLQGDKGFSMKLNFMPLQWDGFAFFSEPEQRGKFTDRSMDEGRGRQQQAQQGNRGGYGGGYGRQQQEDPDEDIPFIRRDEYVPSDF